MTRRPAVLAGVPAAAVAALLLAACTGTAGAGTAGDGTAGAGTAGSGTAGPATSPGARISRSAATVHPSTSATATGSSAHGVDAGAAVGALFPDGTDHPHSCTATVVASASGDVVMTAAHCVSGSGAGLQFVPGYDAGSAPWGVWTVTGAYAPPGWVDGLDEDDDVAFLSLAPQTGDGRAVTVQSLTGGVRVGGAAGDGDHVSITAYDDGLGDAPVRCATVVHDSAAHATINCHGFSGGSSGSAWIVNDAGTPVAVGLIGGAHQGGCEEYTSYSPPFGADVLAALAAAGSGAASPPLPSPPDDGC